MRSESRVSRYLSVLLFAIYFWHDVQCKPLATVTYYVQLCDCTKGVPPPPSPPSPPPRPPPPPPHKPPIPPTPPPPSPPPQKPPPPTPPPQKPPPPTPPPQKPPPPTPPPQKPPPPTPPPQKPPPPTPPPQKPPPPTPPPQKPPPPTPPPHNPPPPTKRPTTTSKPTTRLTRRTTTRPRPTPTSPPEYVLPLVEMVFVVDRSSKLVLHNITNLISIVDDFKTYFQPGSRFGMVLYSDFAKERWYGSDMWSDESWSAEERSIQERLYETKENHHTDPNGCYTFWHSLTTDTKSLKDKARKIKFLSSGRWETGDVALMFGAADKKMKWTNEKNSSIVKVMVIISDITPHDPAKHKPLGATRDIVGDGTDSCTNIRLPPFSRVGEILNPKGILVYGLLQNDSIQSPWFPTVGGWKTIAQQMNIRFGVSDIQKESLPQIIEHMKEFIGYVPKTK